MKNYDGLKSDTSVEITEFMWNWIMMKRRTSKRFVIGETSGDVQNFDEDPVEVIPSSLIQKFQMTVQADEGNLEKEETTPSADGGLLSPPKAATLQ